MLVVIGLWLEEWIEGFAEVKWVVVEGEVIDGVVVVVEVVLVIVNVSLLGDQCGQVIMKVVCECYYLGGEGLCEVDFVCVFLFDGVCYDYVQFFVGVRVFVDVSAVCEQFELFDVQEGGCYVG